MGKLPSVMIGVPSHDMVVASFAQSLVSTVEYMTRRGYKVLPHFWEGTLVRDARTSLMKVAIQSKVDYLFFLDSDMIIKADTAERLINDDCDIVSTKFFRRVEPYQPCFYLEVKTDQKPVEYIVPTSWRDVGIIEVAATGLAATMIRREVLEALPEDVFYHDPHSIGEDIQFCLSARAAGFSVSVDLRLEAGHIGRKVVTQHTYLSHNAVTEERNNDKEE